MQSQQLSKETKEMIETLEGSQYELRPRNNAGRLRAGGGGRFAVAKGNCYVPHGEFLFVAEGSRYRLKVEGGIYKTIVVCKTESGNVDKQREAYFWPVRILAIEAPPTEGTLAEALPFVSGRLMPTKRGRSILADGIAKFRAKDHEPLGAWTPGDQFKVKTRGLSYTVAVERYFAPTHIPERSELGRGGRYGKTWKTTPARTIPEVVMVRVLDVESLSSTRTK